jgi:hypothetical protein
MKAKRFIYTLLVCAVLTGMNAQNFNYQFSVGNSNYVEINNPTYIATNASWLTTSVKIPIGFNLDFMGKTFDSVSVYNNGYLVFDKNFNYGIAAFTFNMGANLDSLGQSSSSISYNISGSAENRILKIQFKDCSVSENSGGVNYQVWLFENQRAFAISVGQTTCTNETLSSCSKMVGLIDLNDLENGQMALLLNGDPSLPTPKAINNGEKKGRLDRFPSANTLYTFVPNF